MSHILTVIEAYMQYWSSIIAIDDPIYQYTLRLLVKSKVWKTYMIYPGSIYHDSSSIDSLLEKLNNQAHITGCYYLNNPVSIEEYEWNLEYWLYIEKEWEDTKDTIRWKDGHGFILAKYTGIKIGVDIYGKNRQLFYILLDWLEIGINYMYKSDMDYYDEYLNNFFRNIEPWSTLKINWILLWWSWYDYGLVNYDNQAVCLGMDHIHFI